MDSQHRGDLWGIVASSACALHCALGPVVLWAAAASPLIADERVELALALAAFAIAFVVLTRAYARHRSALPGALAAAGSVVWATVRALEVELAHAEQLGSIAASVLLIAAHILNVRAGEAARGNAPSLSATSADLRG